MEQVNPQAFTCPPSFTEVINTEGLCLEDVEDEDQELWLIQAPDDLDFTDLDGQQLILNGLTQFQLQSEGDEEEIIECTPKSTMEFGEKIANLVLPKRKSMSLRRVKKEIEGILFIQQKVLYPQLIVPKNMHKNVTVPKDLKRRDVPFGADDPIISLGDHDRSEERCATEDLLEPKVEPSPSARKKKHSHRSKDSSHVDDIPVKREKKKKHKHDKGERAQKEIKTEIME